MVRPRQARLAEAYEVLLEECRLDAFTHHHPTAWDLLEDEKGSIAGGDVDQVEAEAEESASESDGSSTSSSIASSSPDLSRSNTPGLEEESGPTAQDWLVGWTEAELAVFFPSLARRSRWFPDLISQDLNYSKSPSQVAHLLSLLRRGSNLQEEENRAQIQKKEGSLAASRLSRKSRRIGRLLCANEVSDEWLAFEEDMASQLQHWQDNDDAKDGCSDLDTNVKHQSEQGDQDFQRVAEEEEATADQATKDESVVSWDDQVTNALLFLRHHHSTNADTNSADFLYSVPLSAWFGESELKLFSFSSAVAIQLLISRDYEAGLRTSAYKSFSRLHSTPKTHMDNEDKGESLAWRILFRGVELGVLSWVKFTAKKDEILPEGRLVSKVDRSLRSTQLDASTFKRAEGARLIWLDTLVGDRRGQAALAKLQRARLTATRRLLNTLTWEEAQSLHARLRQSEAQPAQPIVNGSSRLAAIKKRKERENSSVDLGLDLSSYSYLERNRIRARLRSRIKRHGKGAALAMPLDPQHSGRRKFEGEGNGNQARKRSRLEVGAELQEDPAKELGEDEESESRESSEEEEEDDTENDVEDEQLAERLPDYNVQPQRFEQIGVTLDFVISQLSETTQNTMKMFYISAIKSVAMNAFRETFDEEANQVEGPSLGTLKLLRSLLDDFLTKAISSAIEIASGSVSARGESRRYITKEQVRAALLLNRLTDSGSQMQEQEESASLDEFRSDPPQFYHTNGEKLQEMEIQLHGLKSLRILPQTRCSMTSDSVISASDAFTLPIHSSYAPKFNSSNDLQDGDLPLEDDYSDSEESSIYDDSDQEREIQMRKDENAGVTRESNRLDGRLWDYNKKRNQMEEKRWQELNNRDQIKAQEHERRLWASVGLEPKNGGKVVGGGEDSGDGSNVESSEGEGEDGEEEEEEEEEEREERDIEMTKE